MRRLNTCKQVDQNEDFDDAKLESLLVQRFYSALTSSQSAAQAGQHAGGSSKDRPDVVRHFSEMAQQRIKELSPVIARLGKGAGGTRGTYTVEVSNCLIRSDHSLLGMLWPLLHLHCLQVGYDHHFLTLVESTWINGLTSETWSARLLNLYRKTLLLWDLELGWHTAFVTDSLHNDPSLSWYHWEKAAREVGGILHAMHEEFFQQIARHSCEYSVLRSMPADCLCAFR